MLDEHGACLTISHPLVGMAVVPETCMVEVVGIREEVITDRVIHPEAGDKRSVYSKLTNIGNGRREQT
ncbi:unnamed protein product [Brugia timori]|uniref:AMP-binding_C domain-containing protein n=1 Tax=Brugia timori TaxID=42155 RepID=A0A0R3Q5C0_9BILA|nr:unnamed protein product [Brugia timori]